MLPVQSEPSPSDHDSWRYVAVSVAVSPTIKEPKGGTEPILAGETGISLQSIRNVTRRIAEEFQPEKIVLFGSYAYGTPGPDSDVDLLVVMDTSLSSRQQRLEISRVLSPRPFPMDILVRTPKDLAERLKLGDSFLQDIISRGKVVYERQDPRL